jgi:hypothetical protein
MTTTAEKRTAKKTKTARIASNRRNAPRIPRRKRRSMLNRRRSARKSREWTIRRMWQVKF